MSKAPKKSEPVTVNGRPVKSKTVRWVAYVEVDGGDLVMLMAEMSPDDALAFATRKDQADIPAVVTERMRREVARREM